MSGTKPGEITRLLEAWGAGREVVLDELMPLGLAWVWLRADLDRESIRGS